MARISIELAEPSSVFGAHFPRTGVVIRDIPSSKQRDWRLVRLDAKLRYQGKANDWLLIRAEDAPAPSTQPAPVDVLLVGEVPQVADGFDEANFARVGAALTSPVYLNLSRWQKFWIRFSLVLIVLAGAGWYAWNYDPDRWFGKLVMRLLFLIPELIK
jgi:hypothetical protein